MITIDVVKWLNANSTDTRNALRVQYTNDAHMLGFK